MKSPPGIARRALCICARYLKLKLRPASLQSEEGARARQPRFRP
jgi:hypothetical protein